MELAVSALFFVLIVVAIPLYALAYGHAEIIVPGIMLAASVPITAFETPIWIRYRRLEFVRSGPSLPSTRWSPLRSRSSWECTGPAIGASSIGIVAGSIAGAAGRDR